MNGDLTVKGQTSEVDVSFADFFQNLAFAAEVHFEATRKDRKYGFWFDGTYMKLESDANIGPINLDIENQTAIIEGAFFYNLHNWNLRANTFNDNLSKPYISLDATAGLRYFYFDAKFDFQGQGPVGISGNIKKDQSWFEPFVGLRSIIFINDRIRMILRTDFGGFGIESSSDFSWLGAIVFAYSITERIEVLAGYRALYLDYDDGTGDERFAMDVWMHNPLIGVNFHF